MWKGVQDAERSFDRSLTVLGNTGQNTQIFLWNSTSECDGDRRVTRPSAKGGKYTEQTRRSFRFPAVEERVEYYMGKWYNYALNRSEAMTLCSWAPMLTERSDRWFDRIYVIDQENLGKIRGLPAGYSADVQDYYFAMAPSRTRFFMAFGDVCPPGVDNVPGLMVTARKASATPSSPHSAILAYFNIYRHFEGPIMQMRRTVEIPWENKTDAILWRGASTGHGSRASAPANIAKSGGNRSDIDVGFNRLVKGKYHGSKIKDDLHKCPIKNSWKSPKWSSTGISWVWMAAT